MHAFLFALVLPFFQPILGKLTSFDITLTTLDPKVTPFSQVEDADPKDMKLRKRSRFKPSTKTEPELKKRFTFQSKKDGASARLCHDKVVAGDVRSWVRVAVDKLDGIVGVGDAEGGGATCFFLGCLPVPEGVPSLAATAVWDDNVQGLSLQAQLDGVPVGEPKPFGGLKDVFLVVERAGGFRAAYWALPVSDDYDGHGALQLLHQEPLPEGPAVFMTMDLGVDNLGKKGRIYVTQASFRVTPGTVVSDNPTETSFGETLFVAFAAVDSVDTALFFPFVGFEGLLDELGTARTALDQLFVELGQEGGAFDPDTPVDQIEKQLERASKAVDQAIAKAEKLQAAKASSHKPLTGVVNRAQKGLRIASALMMGFKTQSLGRLDKTVNY